MLQPLPLVMKTPIRPVWAPERVIKTVQGLESMEWRSEFNPGDRVILPHLSISAHQRGRFTQGFAIYRPSFEPIYDLAAAELHQDQESFTDSFPIFVYGPQGIGKSHALRFAAARLWRDRLHNESNFRILYIADWHSISLPNLKKELKLCFYDDNIMLHRIDSVACAQDVQRLMNDCEERVVVNS